MRHARHRRATARLLRNLRGLRLLRRLACWVISVAAVLLLPLRLLFQPLLLVLRERGVSRSEARCEGRRARRSATSLTDGALCGELSCEAALRVRCLEPRSCRVDHRLDLLRVQRAEDVLRF